MKSTPDWDRIVSLVSLVTPILQHEIKKSIEPIVTHCAALAARNQIGTSPKKTAEGMTTAATNSAEYETCRLLVESGALVFDADRAFCVYFLLSGQDVIYVGQTANLVARLSQHRKTKSFDRVFFLPCTEAELPALEAYWIAKLNPALNIAGPERRFPRTSQFSGGGEAMSQPERYLRSGDVMARLGYKNRSSFWQFVYRSGVPHTRVNSRTIRFDEAALNAWLESKSVRVGGRKVA